MLATYEPRMHNSNLEIRFSCSFGRSQVSCTFFQALIGRGVRRAERTRGCQWVPYDSSGLRSYTPRLTVYSHPTVLVKREKSIQCTPRPQAKHWKASELAVVSVIGRCCAQQAKDWKALADLAVIAVATICYAQQDKHCKALQLILWLRDVVRNQLRTEVSIWVAGCLCRFHLLCAWLVSKMWPKWSMQYSKVSPGKWLDTNNDKKLEEFTLQCFCIKMKIKFSFFVYSCFTVCSRCFDKRITLISINSRRHELPTFVLSNHIVLQNLINILKRTPYF